VVYVSTVSRSGQILNAIALLRNHAIRLLLGASHMKTMGTFEKN